MQHAEVIYETGAHSVVSVDNLDELKAGLAEHHRRAINGEPGGTQASVDRTTLDENHPLYVKPDDFDGRFNHTASLARPAERIKRVILYDYHPADFNVGGTLDAASLHELLEGMTGTHGEVDADQLNAAVRDETSPVYPVNQGRHESIYKMDGEEMDLAFLDGPSAGTESAGA